MCDPEQSTNSRLVASRELGNPPAAANLIPMKIISSSDPIEILTPEAQTEPYEIEDRPAEIRRVVKRLEHLLASHLDSAQRMNKQLGEDDFRSIFAALEAEADGLNPQSHLSCPDTVREYLRGLIYEELLGEPSNILYSTRVSKDVIRYDAMPKEFWKECLAAFRKKLRLD